MKQLPRSQTTDLEHLDLTEVLDFRPDKGIIQLHEQRVVIVGVEWAARPESP